MDRVADMYDEFFSSLMSVRTGGGWYEPNPARDDLDWLTRKYPGHGLPILRRDAPSDGRGVEARCDIEENRQAAAR
jgi:hypothetical protein